MAKLLDLDESDSENGGVQLTDSPDFKINQDFAKKFTHNKKREELRRLEDKLGKNALKRKRGIEGNTDTAASATDSSSESEEDDAGELATKGLDSEINATLNAIRSKDPRVYDQKTTFYSTFDNDQDKPPALKKKGKPMYLRDYHRENLLKHENTVEDLGEGLPLTYNEEQEVLKRSIVSEIRAATANGVASGVAEHDDEASDDGFLLTKKRKDEPNISQVGAIEVEHADKDPETFLSNFMAARAWLSSEQSHFQPFESDDEDEERRAEEFEEAYNFRFEDPAKANEKLTSHARDVASKHSVRREEENARKKRRSAAKEIKAVTKQQLAEEKAQLRKLRIEEVQEKLRKIKRAAGWKGDVLQEEDWARFLNDSWDDASWEEEMRRHFGEAYYMDKDFETDEERTGPQARPSKPKLKKPRWDDDINIGDIVPEFGIAEEAAFSLSEDETNQPELDALQANGNTKSKKTSKTYRKERQESRKVVRKERQKVEELVDKRLDIDTVLLGGPPKAAGFRYRETSPSNYGLSAREILLAPDTKLNEFVGLKKLAAFRDPEKKRKDQKRLGKKARLRKWRSETFGDEEGVNNASLVHLSVEDRLADALNTNSPDDLDTGGNGSKKKRRKKSRKSQLLGHLTAQDGVMG